MEFLSPVRTSGIFVPCADEWNFCPLCGQVEFLSPVRTSGIFVPCADEWNFCPLCGRVEFFSPVRTSGVFVPCKNQHLMSCLVYFLQMIRKLHKQQLVDGEITELPPEDIGKSLTESISKVLNRVG